MIIRIHVLEGMSQIEYALKRGCMKLRLLRRVHYSVAEVGLHIVLTATL